MHELVERAINLRRKGEVKSSIPLFEQAIEILGESSFLLSNLGHSFLMVGETLMAKNVLEKAVNLDSKNSYAIKHLAHVAEKQGKVSNWRAYSAGSSG